MTPRRRRRLVALGAALFCALCVAAAVARLHDKVDPAWLDPRGLVPARIVANPEALLEPAPLSPAHAAVPELSDCRRCHSLSAPVADASCLACHAEIGRRRSAGIGHHGRDLAGRCAECHADHRPGIVALDRAAFNHARASFPLEGEHALVACEKCHEKPAAPPATGVRMRFVGLDAASCRSCHEDPHRGSLDARGCAECHAADGWTGSRVRFDHGTMSRFALDATHARVACASCHATKVFRPTPTDCASCHESQAGFLAGRATVSGAVEPWTPDAHRGRIDCNRCHDTREAPQSAASHAAKCAACHSERYAGLFLERRARLDRLGAEVRSLEGLAPPETLAAARDALRAGSHNPLEAERRARALLESVRASESRRP